MIKLLKFKGKKSIWLDKYNDLIQKSENNPRKRVSEGGTKFSLHHIYPKSEFPELEKVDENHSFLSIPDHIKAHYYLWKYNSKYAKQFWFCYTWYRKNYEDILTTAEYEQLKKDLWPSQKKTKKDKK